MAHLAKMWSTEGKKIFGYPSKSKTDSLIQNLTYLDKQRLVSVLTGHKKMW